MNAFAESWRLLRKSVQVLRAWPVLIGFAGRAIVCIIVAELAIYAATQSIPEDAGWARAGMMGIGCLLVAYVMVFYEAALVTQLNRALDGADPTIAAGTAAAAGRREQLVPWVLLTAAETYALNAVEDAAYATLIGGLWLAVTILVLPTVVLTDTGGWTAIAKALNLLRRHWASCVIGAAMVTAAFALLIAPGLGLLVLEPESTGLLVLLAVAAFVWLLLAVILGVALIVAYRTMLYRTLVGAPEIPR